MGVSKVVLSQTRRRRHECSNPIYPATSAEAIRWFSHKLHLETDCADVHSAQRAGEVDFVLLHVVGSEEAFARRHLRARSISRTARSPPSEWPLAGGYPLCGLLRRAALQRR